MVHSKKFMSWYSPYTPREIHDNGIIIRRSSDVANFMNEYFFNKIHILRSKIPNVPFSLSNCNDIMRNNTCRLELEYVSEFKICKIIKSFGNRKSTAIDGLDTYSIKIAVFSFSMETWLSNTST